MEDVHAIVQKIIAGFLIAKAPLVTALILDVVYFGIAHVMVNVFRFRIK